MIDRYLMAQIVVFFASIAAFSAFERWRPAVAISSRAGFPGTAGAPGEPHFSTRDMTFAISGYR